jgi:hypothetical protein
MEHRSALYLTMHPEMPTLLKHASLLAIDPTSRGFAFAVLEVPTYLVDWGMKTIAPKNGGLLRRVDELLTRHKPDILVLEDLAARGARRRKRANKEIQAMELLAFTRGVRVEKVSRLAVLDTFAPGKSKYEMAVRLAEIFPALASRLPRKRKAWMTEDARTNIFDALGFAVVLVERSRGGGR